MRPSWFALSLTLTTVVACTNDAKPTGLPAASASSPTAPPRSAAPEVASAAPAGPLDYRGTLGKKTGIAMHLAANGHDVTGSYVYTSLGRPIPLAGTVEPSGAYTLNESVKGKVTGTFHLTASGADLLGDWQAPGGANGFPVHLSPGAPWTPVVPDAGGGGRWRQAEACLADPACLGVDAARWFVEGDDAHEAGVDCSRFLDGDGTAKDAKRGRACLERSVGERACEKGSSAGLEGAELAALLIDGVGGAEDVPRARALFADCVEDATTTWVRGRADAKTHDPKTAHLGICDAHDGTTLVSNDCGSRDLARTQTRVHLAEKAVAAPLDDAAKRAFVPAIAAHDAYVRAMGEYAYEVNIEGTIRNGALLARETALYEARAKELASFSKFVAAETKPADLSRDTQTLAAAIAAVTTSTPAEAAAFKKTQDTWETYRNAETAFYVAAFGPTQNADRVQRAVRARLILERAKQCAPPRP